MPAMISGSIEATLYALCGPIPSTAIPHAPLMISGRTFNTAGFRSTATNAEASPIISTKASQASPDGSTSSYDFGLGGSTGIINSGMSGISSELRRISRRLDFSSSLINSAGACSTKGFCRTAFRASASPSISTKAVHVPLTVSDGAASTEGAFFATFMAKSGPRISTSCSQAGPARSADSSLSTGRDSRKSSTSDFSMLVKASSGNPIIRGLFLTAFRASFSPRMSTKAFQVPGLVSNGSSCS
mmetsp:Transcript_917/g.1564  ORF Transcript_917/g.1564 Transcript_917/m.1564 type:complete len:244 (-) Transcript_917:223-954(-)